MVPDLCILFQTANAGNAMEYYERVRAYFHKMLDEHKDIVEFVHNADDIKRITAAKKCAAVLSVEGAAVLGGKLENIEKLARDGVKMMTLTWNGPNELASGNVDPQMGFTDFGREAVKEMERQNIIVDVSHLNDKGMEELMGGLATKPIIATPQSALHLLAQTQPDRGDVPVHCGAQGSVRTEPAAQLCF